MGDTEGSTIIKVSKAVKKNQKTKKHHSTPDAMLPSGLWKMTVCFFLLFPGQLQKQHVLITSAKVEVNEDSNVPDHAPLN